MPARAITNVYADFKCDVYMTKEEQEIKDRLAAGDLEGDKDGQTEGEEGDTEAEGDQEDAEGEGEAEAGTSEKETDFEALLKKEKEDAFKQGAAFAASKIRKDKKAGKTDDEQEEAGDDAEEDKPLTRKEFLQLSAQERQANQKILQAGLILTKARQLAGPKASQAEIDLIVERHKNRVFPESLSLDDQLEEIYAGIHRKKLLGTVNQLKRAIRSKDTAEAGTSSSHREIQPANEPKLAPQDMSALKSAGYEWDGKSRLFIKKLNGGKKTLFYDPKSKKRWVK